MADTKISALTASTTPLAGTEVLPIVQGGVTKQVSVANLTAGRAISATQLTLTTGNLVIGTSGKGVDFSATPGTGTSELLDDYETGTWTPSQGAGLVVVGTFSSDGVYTKVGNLVTVRGRLVGSTSVAATAAAAMCGNLPFSASGQPAVGAVTRNPALNTVAACVTSGTTLFSTGAAADATIVFTVSYFV
jgi:hypothetical protein